MKVIVLSLFSTLILFNHASAITENLSFDPIFDDGATSTSVVACEISQAEFPTFSSIPTFPNIGGIPFITGPESAFCGSCWNISIPTFETSVIFTAIDAAVDAFNVSLETENTLTDGNIVGGVLIVDATQVDNSLCGF